MFMKMDPASGQPSKRENVDMILASSSADANIRLIAVKELIKSISGKEISGLENVVRIFSLTAIDHFSSHY